MTNDADRTPSILFNSHLTIKEEMVDRENVDRLNQKVKYLNKCHSNIQRNISFNNLQYIWYYYYYRW